MIATLTIGIIIGALAGFTSACVLTAACFAAKEIQPPQEPTKPARIFTNGCLVRWRGDIYEIKFFREAKDKQTLACIFKNANSVVGFTVPIEELEEVE